MSTGKLRITNGWSYLQGLGLQREQSPWLGIGLHASTSKITRDMAFPKVQVLPSIFWATVVLRNLVQFKTKFPLKEVLGVNGVLGPRARKKLQFGALDARARTQDPFQRIVFQVTPIHIEALPYVDIDLSWVSMLRTAMFAILQSDPAGFVIWMGILCATWSAMSRGSTRRCFLAPLGLDSLPCVSQANVMVSRCNT